MILRRFDDVRISPDKKRQTEKQAATTPRHRQPASAATASRSSDTHTRVSRTSALAALALTEHSHTHSSLAGNKRDAHKGSNRLLLCNHN